MHGIPGDLLPSQCRPLHRGKPAHRDRAVDWLHIALLYQDLLDLQD